MTLLRYLLYSVSLLLTGLYAQISVTVNNNAAQLANNMVGPGITVSNAIINCPPRASGVFTWTNSSVGLGNGIVLTTGDADSISSNGIFGLTTIWGAPGDADLDAAINSPGWPSPIPTSTEDACILEFDLVPNCDTIAINYIFASAEYNTWVGSTFNDAFAFFITGPGIVGTQNIALIPGTNIPITINSINNGPTGVGPCVNCSYFIDNTGNPPVDPDMEFTGFTQKITARQVAVPCATYHIKFVIADGSDGSLDSGVFLEQGGFRCTTTQLEIDQTTTGLPGNDQWAVRGCIDAILTFKRSGDSTQAMNITYLVGGSAVPGVDYNALPGTLTIPANQSQVTIPIAFFNNGGGNGLDSLLIIISNTNCGVVSQETTKVYILDHPVVSLRADTSLCLGTSINVGYIAEPKAVYNWTPAQYLSSTTIANPRFNAIDTGIFVITNIKTDSLGCVAGDSLVITVPEMPEVSFTLPDTGCLYEDTPLVYDFTQVPGDIYFWDFGLQGELRSGSGSGPLAVKWHTTGVKNVTLFIRRNGCNTDTIMKQIEILSLPVNSFTYQSPICWGKEDTLLFTGYTLDGTIYNWENDNGNFINPNPQNDTLVMITWNTPGTKTIGLWLDQHGCISDTLRYQVQQLPTLAGYIEADTLICSGDSNYIELNIFDGDGGPYAFTWSPQSFMDDPNTQIPVVFPISTTNYEVVARDGCGQELIFSSVVEVHPLPDLPEIFHDTICYGERALLKGFSNPDSFFVHWYHYRSRTEQKHPIFTGSYFPTPPLYQNTIFYVDVEDTLRCKSPRVPAFVYVNPLPKIDFEAMPETMELPVAITTIVPSFKSEAGLVSVYWDLGDGMFSSDSMPVQQYFLEGNYDITLTVVDSNGCISTLTKAHYLKVQKPLIMNLPNAFSPNGDGINDFFHLSHLYLKNARIVIFDRWGNQVFESLDPDFRWDGTLQGNPLPEGVYVYDIRGEDKENVPVSRKGSITLVR